MQKLVPSGFTKGANATRNQTTDQNRMDYSHVNENWGYRGKQERGGGRAVPGRLSPSQHGSSITTYLAQLAQECWAARIWLATNVAKYPLHRSDNLRGICPDYFPPKKTISRQNTLSALKREKEDERRIRERYAHLKSLIIQQAKQGSKNASCPNNLWVFLRTFPTSVPDPKLLITDPDPQNKNPEYRIRIRIWIRIRICIWIRIQFRILDPDPLVN